ncbi:MAG TPA: hypothetical protein VK279_09185 [Solirubrobacteraceae bacterium]|nr:hypothetical protein [Solirubrobacteraceae bacterium]
MPLAPASRSARRGGRAFAGGQRGQASVELVAVLPVVAVLALGLWQALATGQAVWAAGGAARAAARAAAVSGEADAVAAAARRALPERLEDGMRVAAGENGAVEVRLPIRAVVGGVRLWTMTAEARFEPQS